MEYLLVIGIVQALFTSGFLVSKRGSALNDKILAVWMVFIAFPMIGGVAIQMWPDVHIPILRSDLIFPLTYGPFMWLYVRALTGQIINLTRRDLLHFIPFVAVSLFQFLTGWAPAPPSPNIASFDATTRIVGAVNLIIMLSYFTAVVHRLGLHAKEIVQHFSDLPNRVTLRWLYWLIAAIFAVYVLLFLASFLSLPVLLQAHLPAQIAIILTLSFFGLRQTQVFGREQEPTITKAEGNRSAVENQSAQFLTEPTNTKSRQHVKERYSRSGLSDERAERIYRKLEAFMESQKPYLSAELTISELAERMSVSRHHLTEVISTRHNKNFYVFVNEFRIEAVKQAMQTPGKADMTLLDLAYAYGFNSKSPFNAAFKRQTGMTPSQYRNQLL